MRRHLAASLLVIPTEVAVVSVLILDRSEILYTQMSVSGSSGPGGGEHNLSSNLIYCFNQGSVKPGIFKRTKPSGFWRFLLVFWALLGFWIFLFVRAVRKGHKRCHLSTENNNTESCGSK